jgi:hypothetical protein
MQFAEVAVILDEANGQDSGKHHGCLPGAQDWTAQQRLAVAHFASHHQPMRQQFCWLEALFPEPSTTTPSCDDIALGMIGFPMTDQDQSHLA